MSNLKPCPLCNANLADFAYQEESASITCRNCGFAISNYRDEKLAERDWNVLPRALRFSKDKPDEAGLWLWKMNSSYEPVLLKIVDPKNTEKGGLWAGPIRIAE